MNLTGVLARHEINLSGTNDAEMLGKLKLLLKNAQNLSLRQRDQRKKTQRFNAAEGETSPGDRVGRNDFLCDFDNVQIIRGNINIITEMINLSKQAPKTPPANNNKILITINNDIKILTNSNGINQVWIQSLHMLLKSGWKLVFHISLDGDVQRTIGIIENIQALLTTGNLSVYYHLKQPNETTRDTELCIIPGAGALLCFSTHGKNTVDSAFLFHSKDSIELLTKRFFHNLNSAEPLLTSYPHLKVSEFQQVFSEYEAAPGDKCVFKRGLSTATLPLDLYSKYLEFAKVPDQTSSYRKFLHKRRLDAFHEHVLHYSYRDICFFESVIDLVEKGKYSFDEDYLFEAGAPQKEDIIRHLEYLIELLEHYDNYNLAFVSLPMFRHLQNIYWMVKDSSCVLIEIHNETCSPDHPHSEMNFSITEKSVVHAFQNYFNNLWDKIGRAHV
jgi:hypothetical protein